MKLQNKKSVIIIRILLGLVFVVSAITKLKSIDSFEIYIYSFGVLNLNSSFLFARFIISLELLIGALFFVGIYIRKTILISIVLLSVFTVFIVYLLFNKNSEHCHCFGDVIVLSNISSIIKNTILTFFLIIIYQKYDFKLKYRKLLFIASFIISISIPLIISPPDSMFYKNDYKNVNYNDAQLKKYIEENKQYTKGKHVLCFFGTGCKFCKLATRKISVIANKSNKDNFINCVFWGSKKSVDIFYKETNSIVFQYSIIPQSIFLKITNGQMPLIILLENGVLKGRYGYRSINENEIISFLKY